MTKPKKTVAVTTPQAYQVVFAVGGYKPGEKVTEEMLEGLNIEALAISGHIKKETN